MKYLNKILNVIQLRNQVHYNIHRSYSTAMTSTVYANFKITREVPARS